MGHVMESAGPGGFPADMVGNFYLMAMAVQNGLTVSGVVQSDLSDPNNRVIDQKGTFVKKNMVIVSSMDSGWRASFRDALQGSKSNHDLAFRAYDAVADFQRRMLLTPDDKMIVAVHCADWFLTNHVMNDVGKKLPNGILRVESLLIVHPDGHAEIDHRGSLVALERMVHEKLSAEWISELNSNHSKTSGGWESVRSMMRSLNRFEHSLKSGNLDRIGTELEREIGWDLEDRYVG